MSYQLMTKDMITAEKIRIVRERTGSMVDSCKRALQHFNGNVGQACGFLIMRGNAMTYFKSNGSKFATEQDFIEYIKNNIKED